MIQPYIHSFFLLRRFMMTRVDLRAPEILTTVYPLTPGRQMSPFWVAIVLFVTY